MIPEVFMAVSSALRVLVLGLAIGAVMIATLDWAVRTRRINPFSGLARFSRKTVAPIMAPVERRVISVGGNPQNASWWLLAGVVVIGLVLIALFDFVAREVLMIYAAATGGVRGIVRLLIGWAIGLLQIALIIRVVSSWFRVGRYSRWVGWTYPLTEWMLAPLRRVLPPIGGTIDLSPLIAYFLLFFVRSIVLGLI